ncbi:hypothetical protein JCM33374_g257 [Metschnikowia sp. JCM 33374]|nr:hypothetical protein JCM33374_g257 [Metschnikowia sp. JCM 33374]
MSFPDVLKRGEDFLSEYPRTAPWWNYVSHATCFGMLMGSKALLNIFYNPQVHNVEKLDWALERARKENRALLTVMNHMSVVDDPGFFSMLPMRFLTDIDTIRWGFGAHNICFSTPSLSWFFNFGKILGTKRFGEGPFQGSIDAAIRVLSPDDTLDLEFSPWAKDQEKPLLLQEINNISGVVPQKVTQAVKVIKPNAEATNVLMSKSPFIRSKTSWFHVFPEGFVLQLEEPENNSMRYFKWGVARLILESTRVPVVVPVYSYGFEKIVPEDSQSEGIKRWLPHNIGAEIHVTFGDAISDERLESYRREWRKLCETYTDPKNPQDLSPELMHGKKAQNLRSRLAADLREHVSAIREGLGKFAPEKSKFKDPVFWKEYTKSEGASDPEVKFIGQNWAIRRLQKHLPDFEEDGP